jgi:hypothetical protein
MPDISLTRNTQLRGSELQTTVRDMIHDLSGRSPYNVVRLSQSWASPTQITLSASPHMSGTVTLRDGNPSTVTVQMDLLSSLAQGQRSRVIQDMNAIADRYLGGTATATAAATTTTAAAEEERERRLSFDWNLFGNIMANIGTGLSTGFEAMNEAYAQTTAEQAVAVASDTVAQETASGKQVFDGMVLGPGQDVTSQKTGLTQPSLATPVMSQPRGGMPTWGWWALGIGGGAVAVGLIVYLMRR